MGLRAVLSRATTIDVVSLRIEHLAEPVNDGEGLYSTILREVRAGIVQRQAPERFQPGHQIFTDSVGAAPSSAAAKEREPSAPGACKGRVGFQSRLELAHQIRVSGRLPSGQFLEYEVLADLLWLENGGEKAPAQPRVGGLRLQPVNGDFAEPLVERDDRRSLWKRGRRRDERAFTEVADFALHVFTPDDGVPALEGSFGPSHPRATIELHASGPDGLRAVDSEAMCHEGLDHARPRGWNDVSGGRGHGD